MRPEVYARLAEVEATHWWFRSRRAIAATLIASLDLPRDAAILEAGCGTGGNLAMLREFGTVSAFEPSELARPLAADRGLAEVHSGRLPDGIPRTLADFDLVCAFDVLEHVDDDRAAAAALLGCAKPGGHLVITVPAFDWLWSPHDESHEHRRRYSRPQLRALLAGAGCTDVRASYFNTLLFPLIAGLRLGRRMIRSESGAADEALPAPLLNGLLGEVFASERHLLRHFDLPFGVSLLALAQRPG